MTHKLIKTDDYLLVVDDSEIKDCYYWNELDQEIRKNNNINHPYHKKIIAHLPLKGSPILEGVDLLPPIEDDVEELAYNSCQYSDVESYSCEFGFIKGHNKAREKYKYTEQDLLDFANWCRIHDKKRPNEVWMIGQLLTKYESINQYPTEFECEMIPCNPIKYTTEDHLDVEPKTITTAQGIQWVGKYK